MTIIEKKIVELVEIKVEQDRLRQEIEFLQGELAISVNPINIKSLSVEIAERQKKIIPYFEMIEYEHRIIGVYEKYIKPFKLNWYYPGDEFALSAIRNQRGEPNYMPSERSLKSTRFSNLRMVNIGAFVNIFHGLPVDANGQIPFEAFNYLGLAGDFRGFDISMGFAVSTNYKRIFYNASGEMGVDGKHGYWITNDYSPIDAGESASFQITLHNINYSRLEIHFSNNSENFNNWTHVAGLNAYVPEFIDEAA